MHLNIILSVQTDLVILAHVDLSLKTDALVKAEQIWRTPLKLWRQRQMSATAVHFSMACEKQCAMFRGGATRNLVRILPARDTTRLAGSPPRTPPAQTSVDGIQ